jgi:hypothetical protein
MSHLAAVLRIEADHSNEGVAGVLAELPKASFGERELCRPTADGDDQRFGVFSLRYGGSFVLIIAATRRIWRKRRGFGAAASNEGRDGREPAGFARRFSRRETARRSMAWPTEMFLPSARRREASKL